MVDIGETLGDLLSADKLEEEAKRLVYDSDDSITYMDAVLEICEKRGIEPEAVAGIITPWLKARIRIVARDLHFLPPEAELPEEIE